MALLGATAAVAAEDLGTLFLTREERARLDQLRRGEPESGAPATAARAARITGFVKRSDGRNTVWIDGLAVPVGTREGERILQPGAVREHSDRGEGELRVERKK